MTMACSDKAQVPDLPWGGVEQGGDRRRGGGGGRGGRRVCFARLEGQRVGTRCLGLGASVRSPVSPLGQGRRWEVLPEPVA